MSNRARQLNRGVVETPLWSDNKVGNVASSMVTMPLIRSGPCSGVRGAPMHCSWAKRTSGAWSSDTKSVKAESMADWVLAEGGSVSRRRWVTGSTSKTVSPVSSRGTGVSGTGLRSYAGASRRRIFRACSKVRPSRVWPHQESGNEARGSQALRPMLPQNGAELPR